MQAVYQSQRLEEISLARVGDYRIRNSLGISVDSQSKERLEPVRNYLQSAHPDSTLANSKEAHTPRTVLFDEYGVRSSGVLGFVHYLSLPSTES